MRTDEEVAVTLQDITTEQRPDDWIAFVGSDRGRWESGSSEAEAIGQLLITLRGSRAVGLFDRLSVEQREALRGMVASWVDEGSEEPPYDAVDYDIFEALGLETVGPYDLRRPA